MSSIPAYDIKREPYYDYFIRNGYKYLGCGYMHTIFEKDGVIYKLVRSKFTEFDKKYDYEFEKYNLDLLRDNGFPTPHVLNIYDKGEFIDNFIVMAQEKVSGIIKNEKTLNSQNVREIMNVQQKVRNIKYSVFGQLYNKNLLFNSWEEYMSYLINRAQKAAAIFQIPFEVDKVQDFFSNEYQYKNTPCYLILDPNEENFLFDEHDKISGIIDIDHPICFDPLYEPAVCLYAKKYIFEMMRKLQPEYYNNNLQIIKMYATVHSLADILFLYDKDKVLFAEEIKTCAQNVYNFHNFLKDYV